MSIIIKYGQLSLSIYIKTAFLKQRHVGLQQQMYATSLKNSKWGLGIPTHIQMTFVLIDIQFIPSYIEQYTLLVFNRALLLPLLLVLLRLNSYWTQSSCHSRVKSLDRSSLTGAANSTPLTKTALGEFEAVGHDDIGSDLSEFGCTRE